MEEGKKGIMEGWNSGRMGFKDPSFHPSIIPDTPGGENEA
jgi:hypothetical protein